LTIECDCNRLETLHVNFTLYALGNELWCGQCP
jgi:hypothetical protein